MRRLKAQSLADFAANPAERDASATASPQEESISTIRRCKLRHGNGADDTVVLTARCCYPSEDIFDGPGLCDSIFNLKRSVMSRFVHSGSEIQLDWPLFMLSDFLNN